MYAVIRTGGKQYRVAPGDVLKIERPAGNAASEVEFDDVLAFSDGKSPIIKPENARVIGSFIGEGRGDKVLVFHFKRKKQYKKLQGHRQSYAEIRITSIEVNGSNYGVEHATAATTSK
jgi:large subunit ribosomal protein L21